MHVGFVKANSFSMSYLEEPSLMEIYLLYFEDPIL